jgi:hypothetical protein
MSENYLQTSFAFDLTTSEAAHLATALAIIALLDDADQTPALTAWNDAPQDFKALFPSPDESPLTGLLELFSDPDYPQFGATFDIDPADEGTSRVHISGDQFDPDATANLLAAVVETSFPIICTWAATCSKPRLDEFTGGGFRLEKYALHYISASQLYDNSRFEPRYVLATHDRENGLQFWTSQSSFGALADAQSFTAAARTRFQPPPDAFGVWLQLPTL